MSPGVLLLCALTAQVPAEEPIWVGSEGVIRVSLKDPEVKPSKWTAPTDQNRVPPIIIKAVNQVGKDSKSEVYTYEIRYIGMQTGEHDLRDFLNFSEDANRQLFPPIVVSVANPLPPEHHGQLETPPVLERSMREPSVLSRTLVWAASAWAVVMVLAGIAAWLRWRNRRVHIPAGPVEDSLVQRLRLAENQRLTPHGLAAIERELIDRWRRELDLGASQGQNMIKVLEQDVRGRNLLAALQEWQSRLQSGPAPLPALLKEWAERSSSPQPAPGSRQSTPEDAAI
jgi:hypothetical protein